MQTKMHAALLQICIILGAISQVSCQDFGLQHRNGYRNVAERRSTPVTQLNAEEPSRALQPLSLIPTQNATSTRKRKRTRARRPKMGVAPVDEVFSGGLVLDRRPKYNEQPPDPDVDVAMGRVNSTSDVRKMVLLNLPDLIEKQIRLIPKPLNTLYLSGSFKDLLKPPAGAFIPTNIAGSTLIGLRKITHSKIQVVNVTQSPVKKTELQEDEQESFPISRTRVFKQGADSMNSPYGLMDTMIDDPPKPPRRKLRRKKITTSNLPLLPSTVTVSTPQVQVSVEELSRTQSQTLESPAASASSTEASRRRKRRRKIQGLSQQNQQSSDNIATVLTTATTPLRRTTAAPSTRKAVTTQRITSQKPKSVTPEDGSWEEDSAFRDFHKSNFEPLKQSPRHHAEPEAVDYNDKNLSSDIRLRSTSSSTKQPSSTALPKSPLEPVTQLVSPSLSQRTVSRTRLQTPTAKTSSPLLPSSTTPVPYPRKKYFSTSPTSFTSEQVTEPISFTIPRLRVTSRNLQQAQAPTTKTPSLFVPSSPIPSYRNKKPLSTTAPPPKLTEEPVTELIPSSQLRNRGRSRILSHVQTTTQSTSSPLFPSYIPRKKRPTSSQPITISTSSPILTKDNVLVDNLQHLLSTTAVPTYTELEQHTEKDSTNQAFQQLHKTPVRRFRFQTTPQTSTTSTAKVQHLGFTTQEVQQTNVPFRSNSNRFPLHPNAKLPSTIPGVPIVPSRGNRQRIPFSSALVDHHQIPTPIHGLQRQHITRWPPQEPRKNHGWSSVSHSETLKQQRQEQVASTFPPTPFYHDEIGQTK